MSKLGDVFGEDFEEEYKQKEQMRQQKRSKVDKSTLMEACWHAVNGDGFDGEEPRFKFDAGDMNFDVMLMRAPDNDLQKFKYELSEDTMSMGMFHLDELFSCAFQGDMVELIDKIEPEEYYVVVGSYEERHEMKNGEEEVYYNINPVAGIAPIAQAKKYADEMDEKMAGSSVEEQSQQQNSETSTDDDDPSDVEDDIDISDDEPSTPSKSDVMKVFKVVTNKKEQLLRDVSGGDDDSLSKLTSIVDSNVDGEATEEFVADTFEEEIDDIDGRGEEEEEDIGIDLGDDDEDEDEEDGVDLGGSDDEDNTEDEADVTDENEEGGDGDGDVEDWF